MLVSARERHISMNTHWYHFASMSTRAVLMNPASKQESMKVFFFFYCVINARIVWKTCFQCWNLHRWWWRERHWWDCCAWRFERRCCHLKSNTINKRATLESENEDCNIDFTVRTVNISVSNIRVLDSIRILWWWYKSCDRRVFHYLSLNRSERVHDRVEPWQFLSQAMWRYDRCFEDLLEFDRQ